MQDKIRALAAELIGAIRPDGGCEFMSAIAEPLPITVFLRLLGLPIDQRDVYLRLAQAHFDALENEPHKLAGLQIEVAELMAETVEARRTDVTLAIVPMILRLAPSAFQHSLITNMERLASLLDRQPIKFDQML